YLAIEISHALGTYLRFAALVVWAAFSLLVIGARQPWLGTYTIAYSYIIDSIVAGTYEIASLDLAFYWLIRAAALFVSTPGIFVVLQVVFMLPFAIACRIFGGKAWPMLLFFY